jgi:hypothetical protein
VYITLRQLLVRGDEGLWFVTDVLPNELRQADRVDLKVTRRTVARFMQRRIEGEGAEEFLSAEGAQGVRSREPAVQSGRGIPICGLRNRIRGRSLVAVQHL